MKVTVCFGSVRVLVPCGAGDLLVRDLIREATLRYKKATGQGPETWIGVRALRASSGGILDLDDRVRDVADDRETLTAECANQAQPRAAQADGASGSSAGTASPDMFRGVGSMGGSMRVPNTDSCVEVGVADLEDGSNGLQVRRGSEPTLHQDTLPPQRQDSDQTKRWSTAVVCREDSSRATHKAHAPGAPADHAQSHGHFQRQTNRLSMQFSGPGSGVWLDAAERVQIYGSKSLPRDARKEPLGQDTPPANDQNHRVEDMLRWVSGVNNVNVTTPAVQERPLDLLPETGSSERAISGTAAPLSASKPGVQRVAVTLVKGEKGLGFTITTRDNPTGGHCPIYIKNILPKKVEAPVSPTKYIEKSVGTPIQVKEPSKQENGRVSSMVNAINQSSIRGRIPKSSSKDDLLKDHERSLDSAMQDALNSSSNSLLGLRNRLILRLDVPVHDSEKAGLGISVKGKVTVGSEPHDLGIFIKSVLHGGAASRDGRLHTNDQLLSVNGVSLAGQANADAMETLRRALLHARPHVRGSISLTIARRTDSMDSLARWKDDTPPNGNDTTNSNENSNSQNFNTVIYNTTHEKENKSTDYQKHETKEPDIRTNKKHASIVTINNNNSWVSNQSDDSKGYLERDKETIAHDSKRDSFEWSRLDGWNPVIDRLTGLRNESYYMATQTDAPVNGHHYRQNLGHVHMSRSPPAHHNVIIEEDYGTTRGSEGGGGAGAGAGADAFSRDAVGRRSMSEKRHAALDARATGTYRKIKENKAISAMQVGPSLGMRKSSSLESLQTAIQETQRNPNRNEPIYARAHPPLKHWLTDDNAAPDTIVRGSPQQSSLSHKKPSLLKSLSTMFRIGKPHKKTETEVYGRSQPGRASEKSISRDALERRDDAPTPIREERGSRQSSSERRSGHAARAHRTAPAPYDPHNQAVDTAWGPTGHYVNYEEIQQNLNARREKLSEVQIGQVRRTNTGHQHLHTQVLEDRNDSRRSGAFRPQSNFYEYDSAPPRARRPALLTPRRP